MKPKYEHFTRTAKGTEKVLPPMTKKALHRTLSQGREKQIMPNRAKEIKLTPQIWNARELSTFFYLENINAGSNQNNGWFISFNSPARKMTAQDQLDLMLAPKKSLYVVRINREHKHMVIDNKDGEKE